MYRRVFRHFQVEKITDHQFLETLELRIAPASLLSFSDADGDSVKVRLTGPGTVTGDHNRPDADRITDPSKSVLQILVKKARHGDGLADIDSLTGGGLKSLSAGKIDFTGTGIALTGMLGKISVHDLLNGADITSGEQRLTDPCWSPVSSARDRRSHSAAG